MGSFELLDQTVSVATSRAVPAAAIPNSRERFEIVAGLFERLADLAGAFAATILAYATYELMRIGRHVHYSADTVLLAAIGFALVFVVMQRVKDVAAVAFAAKAKVAFVPQVSYGSERDGKRFELYKFRSMREDAPKYGFHPNGSSDPRVTHVGRWLRKSSLDDLPQLVNILKGEMSLVGPRPEMPFIVDGYEERHRQRLNVIPGLTGLWQLSADRAFFIHANIQYDLYYIRHRNFFMDLAILLHTAAFAMKGV